MHRTCLLIALLALAPALKAQAPKYTAEGISNTASWEIGNLAPYTFATVFGENLSEVEIGRDGHTPGGLGAVKVFVNDVETMVFYVSPKQVNFLVPIMWMPGDVKVRIANRGISGPVMTVNLREYAPALFQFDEHTVVAQRWPEYAVALPDAPARPGEIIVLYATGLGKFQRPIGDYDPVSAPIEIAARKDFRLLLDKVPVDDSRIWYVGGVDQYWGLYQINLLLPENVGNDPEIQIAIGDYVSRPGLRLPLRR